MNDELMRRRIINEFLLTEMAKLGDAQYKKKGKKWEIYIDSHQTKLGEPYFKYYDSYSYLTAEHVARISFLEPRYIIHHSYPPPFELDRIQKLALLKFLTAPAPDVYRGLSNWQRGIIIFNNQNVSSSYDGWSKLTTEKMNNMKLTGRMRFALPIDLPMPDYMQL